jgi:glyoxylase-like metal-dependent hydrolase (beta-lactamase superfamily II)
MPTIGAPYGLPPGVVRLGLAVKLDGRTSWGAGRAGWMPISCHAVVDRDDGVIVDSGVPSHRQAITAQLRDLTARRITLVLTRLNEFDAIGNAVALCREEPVDRVYMHYPSLHWLEFEPGAELAGSRAEKIDVRTLASGGSVPVCRDGSRDLEVLHAPIRLLNTSWLYDKATRTLFTSDAFAHALIDREDDPPNVDFESDTSSTDDVYMSLMPKFSWLFGADVSGIRSEVIDLFEQRDVRAIAPGLGCALIGSQTVERHVNMLLEVLDDVGRTRRRGD